MKRKSLMAIMVIILFVFGSSGPAFASGQTEGSGGDNITFYMDLENSTLTFSGKGEMYNRGSTRVNDMVSIVDSFPWDSYKKVTKSIIINDGISSIGAGVFTGFNALETVIIPNSVVKIKSGAFHTCVSLKNVTIPESVKELNGFSMTGLTHIDIPSGVISIGDSAFWGCQSLEAATIPNSVENIGAAAFRNCASLKSIRIPDSVTNLGEYVFWDCNNLTDVILSNNITSIGRQMFLNCYLLQSLDIPAGVTNIGDSAFSNCFSLKSINIPDSVNSIGNHAFYKCQNLSDIYYSGSKEQWDKIDISGTLNDPLFSATVHYNSRESYENVQDDTPASVPELPLASGSCGDSLSWSLNKDKVLTVTGNGSMWEYSTNSDAPWNSRRAQIEEIVIEDGVTTICSYAFSDCRYLTSVTIPNSIIAIEHYAFLYDDSLTDIYYKGTKEQWSSIHIEDRDRYNSFTAGKAILGDGYVPLVDADIHYIPATSIAAAVEIIAKGKNIQWTDAAPFIDENSRTMVPLRAVGDALGLTVDWDNAAREAIFTNGTKTIYFPIGSNNARTSEGSTIPMDTAAVIVNNRTYAPVRYLAEYFGYTVSWDGDTRTVVIQ